MLDLHCLQKTSSKYFFEDRHNYLKVGLGVALFMGYWVIQPGLNNLYCICNI